MLKEFIKNIIKLSPIPLSLNHKYDILTRKIINNLSKNANCIDIGCFKGEILDLMLKASPKGHHFAFEPIPVQFDYLQKKYVDKSNCTIYNMAASNAAGVSDFNYVSSNPSYSGLKKRNYDKPNEIDSTIRVKTERIDAVIPENISIQLIKIDVEGAELQVLEGAEKIIEKYKPLVVFEHGIGASDCYGTKPGDLYGFFEKMSMQISTLDSFIVKGKSLTLSEFEKQYFEKLNYYFIAHI